MDSIFINNKNAKTSDYNRLRLYFTDKLDLRKNKTVVLANLSNYYTWLNVKSGYNNNKIKIGAPTWNGTFDLPGGSNRIPDIQDCFLKINQKHEPTIDLNEKLPVLINLSRWSQKQDKF